jgi:hypothetical protein
MSGRRALFAALTAVGGSVLAVAVAELSVRVIGPRLPVQEVGLHHAIDLNGDGEGIFWRSRSSQNRMEDGCPEGASGPRVLVQGSSILYGSSLEGPDASGPRLREALAARGLADACVRVHAEPASTFFTQRADLRDADATPTDLLIWELWHNSLHQYTRLGDVAYNFGQLAVGPDGVPDPFGLGPLARPLLQHSRLYGWMALNRAPRRIYGAPVAEEWAEFAPTFVEGARNEAERRGATLVVASFPGLGRPFSEQFESNARTYSSVLDALRAEGVTVIEMDHALVEHDPVDIRADTCCHYNAAGMEVVSGILADTMVPLLSPETTKPDDAPGPTGTGAPDEAAPGPPE